MLLAGAWEHKTMSVGDVVKLYLACDVLGVDHRDTIFNIARNIVPNCNKYIFILALLACCANNLPNLLFAVACRQVQP